MKTDALFYELFKFEPQALFQLLRLKMEGRYSFESITAKTTEKRFDGFLKNETGQGPHIFLEIQGYNDPKIYWRLFREISTYYEQSDQDAPFMAIVLFIEAQYDPGNFPLSCIAPCRLISANLADCLKGLGDQPSPLTVLQPLVFADREELAAVVPQWKNSLNGLKLPEHQANLLLELLEYAIIQRFPELTLKEIQTMIELTPLDKTAAGKELIQMGQAQGLEQGELIGRIQALQEVLKRPISPKEDLLSQHSEELEKILAQLKKQLS